ncbi:hypothetical protein [Kribbella sp.]|uniref:hypothetical protein n=1 Tax=Kribbella sp. TaxID=1871183 RepID=UPI002D2EA0BA|nr:hypothetical protein [Kribbella sp.]HZX04132.1 hypothetical protein [Kribbella sp.]
MGQFAKYIGRRLEPPAGLRRAVNFALPALLIFQAVASRRLEDILAAVVFTALLLPAGIAPQAYRARLTDLDRHVLLSTILSFVLMATSLFVLLAKYASLSRPTSMCIAVPSAIAVTVVGAFRQHDRTKARTTAEPS